MKIFINEVELDYSLEEEKNIKDIINSIENHFKEFGFFIKDIELNGSLYKDENISLNEIDTLNFNLEPILQYLFYKAEIIYNYFSILENSLNHYLKFNENFDIFKDNLKEFDIIMDAINNIFEVNNNEIIDDLSFDNKETLDKDIIKLSRIIENNKKIFENILKELKEPFVEFKQSLLNLINSSHLLEELSYNFQSGAKDKGFLTVYALVQMMKKINKLYTYIIWDNSNNEKIDQYMKEFNNIFNELSEAVDLKDTVLISDLIEYEIFPIIKDLYDNI